MYTTPNLDTTHAGDFFNELCKRGVKFDGTTSASSIRPSLVQEETEKRRQDLCASIGGGQQVGDGASRWQKARKRRAMVETCGTRRRAVESKGVKGISAIGDEGINEC